PPSSPLFPSTTLFRSVPHVLALEAAGSVLEAVNEAHAIERYAVQVLAVQRAAHVHDGGALALERLDVLYQLGDAVVAPLGTLDQDRKSTRLNSSHVKI